MTTLFTPTGRAPRSTFWGFHICFFGVAFLLSFIPVYAPGLTETRPMAFIWIVNAVLWPFVLLSIIIQIKRWHDRDKSGWWVLINLIPYLGQAWTVIECGFMKGTVGNNRFGLDPLSSSPPKA